jgi:hypothetical protein
MPEPLIRFVCRTAAHQRAVLTLDPAEPTSPVTLFQREWAYCPSGATDGHQWERIAGAAVQDIRVRLAHAQRA